MAPVVLNQKQARQIAEVIYADIAQYVQDNWEKYQEFLRTEEKSIKGEKQT